LLSGRMDHSDLLLQARLWRFTEPHSRLTLYPSYWRSYHFSALPLPTFCFTSHFRPLYYMPLIMARRLEEDAKAGTKHPDYLRIRPRNKRRTARGPSLLLPHFRRLPRVITARDFTHGGFATVGPYSRSTAQVGGSHQFPRAGRRGAPGGPKYAIPMNYPHFHQFRRKIARPDAWGVRRKRSLLWADKSLRASIKR